MQKTITNNVDCNPQIVRPKRSFLSSRARWRDCDGKLRDRKRCSVIQLISFSRDSWWENLSWYWILPHLVLLCVCLCVRSSLFPSLSLLTLISSTLSFKYLHLSDRYVVGICIQLAESNWRTVNEVANELFVMKGTLQILQTVFVIFFSWFPRKCPAAGQWAKRSGKEMQIFCTSFTYVTTVSLCICQSLFIFVCFSTDTYYRQVTHNKRPTGGGKDNERRSV